MSLPWVVRSIVNSFIPADKKDKVQFVGDSEASTVMRALFEPHQLEQRYGGTASDLAPDETYPFRFFPNATGQMSPAQDDSADRSLDMFTDRAFHEGQLWDESTTHAIAKWKGAVLGQSLTTMASQDLKRIGVDTAKACTDVISWLQLVNPEEAQRRQRERTS